MKKVQCLNGHFYDLDRFLLCPICGSEMGSVPEKKPLMDNPTSQGTFSGGKTGKTIDNISQTVPLLGDIAAKMETDEKNESTVKNYTDGNCETQKKTVAEGDIKADGNIKIENKTNKISKIDELAPTEIIRDDDEPDWAAEEVAAAMTMPKSVADPVSSYVTSDERQENSALHKALANTGSKAISALPKTVAYYDMDADVEPPVGWVVCVKGPYCGTAFECKVGRNRFGRMIDYEICLTEDTTVSREANLILIYEPSQRQFYVQAGSGDGLAYLNGKLLFDHEEIRAYDKLAVGASEFVFVPLCGEIFTWDDYIAKG